MLQYGHYSFTMHSTHTRCQISSIISPHAPRATSKVNLSVDVGLHLLRPKAVGLVPTICDALSPQGLGLVA